MKLEAGVTEAADGLNGAAWNVVGHTYTPKLHCDHAFVWHAVIPDGTFVPPHIHTTQDEWITVLDGELEVEFGPEKHVAQAGDTIRMPQNEAHGIFNRSGKIATAVFSVAPAGRLYALFAALDNVTDPAELVRISAEHDVNFLPPPDAA
ncbi:cupin domain-containing protein [Amorphus sp. 3PC139-8]|uniref:cupin domain-containing protein n=1 Tax=Amorphus sp. 3PC139-8 TaxID=2735676 RepID=UPI00345DEC81